MWCAVVWHVINGHMPTVNCNYLGIRRRYSQLHSASLILQRSLTLFNPLSFLALCLSLSYFRSFFRPCKSLYKFARFELNFPLFRVCCQLTKVFFKTQLAALSAVRLCLYACVSECMSVHPFWPLTRVSANFIKGLPASKTKLSFKW